MSGSVETGTPQGPTPAARSGGERDAGQKQDLGVGDTRAPTGNGDGDAGPNASASTAPGRGGDDVAPGEEPGDETLLRGVWSYVVGLVAAALLTIASFGVAVAGKHFIYPPALPMVLVALAVGQMGVHLVFFLHITTGPDNTNNVLALAFGTLIVGLVMVGSLWIMANLDATHHMAMNVAAPMRMGPADAAPGGP